MITAYMKGTNRCNVGCTHCYLPEQVRANGSRMSLATIEQSAAFLADMQLKARHESTHVIWHGGEPLVLPPEFYYAAGAVLDRVLPGHTESMQTSLIPLRPEFIGLIKDRFDSFVGSSIDFGQRQIKGSVDAYHQLFMKKVDLARDNGILVIPGVVPSSLDVGREREMVDWFVDRGFPAFNIDRYNAYEAVFPDRPSNKQHAQFLIGLADALFDRMQTDQEAPIVGAIKAGITGILYGVGGDRWGGTCMSDFVVIEPDGSLNNCPDKSSVEEPFGNVAGGYLAFSGSKLRRKWVRHQNFDHKKSHCHGCENQHFCQSGCPITPNGFEDGEDECSGYHSFLSHLRRVAKRDGGRDVMVAYLNQSIEAPALDVYTRAMASTASASRGACAL